MSKPMTAAQTKAAFKKWGVKAFYLPGWEKRGRPASTAGGAFAPNGIMIHHTGSDNQSQEYIEWLFLKGRPAEGIPAPLANVMSMMNGNLIVGAIGKANHAGAGSQAILDKVIKETISLREEEVPGASTVNGNPRFYGNEVAFDGGQPMTVEQYKTTIRWCAAICDFHGWTAQSIIGHGEWTKAKWDPGKTDMAKLRRDVAALLKAGPGDSHAPVPLPPPNEVVLDVFHWNVAGSDTVNGYKAENAWRGPYVGNYIETYKPDVIVACEAGQDNLRAGISKGLGITSWESHAKAIWHTSAVKKIAPCKAYADTLYRYLRKTKYGAAIFGEFKLKKFSVLEVHLDHRAPAKQAKQLQSIFKKWWKDCDKLGIRDENRIVAGDFNWDHTKGDNPFKALEAWSMKERGSTTIGTFLETNRHLDGFIVHTSSKGTSTRKDRRNAQDRRLSDHYPFLLKIVLK